MSGQPPVVWHEAAGYLVRDPYGNQWIDFTSGIVLANAGHAHPRIVDAIRTATESQLLATYAFAQSPRLDLLEKLVSLSPIEDSKAILFSAGTEATECAMMLMRRHGQKIDPAKVGIVSFSGGYHGRTLAASLAGGEASSTDWLDRRQVGHYQIPFPFGPRWPWGRMEDDPTGERAFEACVQQLASQGIQPEHIAGFIGEAVPGWATWPLPHGFAAALMKWAQRHNIIVCFDEVQSGCGRTGRWYGFEHCGVVPDLITLGKGLSSSLPVSAVVGRRAILDDPPPGSMSSTHGGNPVCAAAAMANLQVLQDERLIEASAQTGQLVLRRLQSLKQRYPNHILSIHGVGLFISIHLRCPQTGEPNAALADAIAMEAVQRGVMLFLTGRGFIKIAPPLCIDAHAALEGAQVLEECFDALIPLVD
ncbi:MAG: aminotransferase class III-fold pyridoxal phosphate-dependent enzyme [Planctomycetota bacterium]|nr:aminotransferase class III-fold pyridoxal phosphate-dependent enzyme [Planctomycetota bacterium]